MPYEIKSDNVACFGEGWEKEPEKLGVRVLHSSAYNSQSNSLVERSVRTLKEILVKNGNLSQLMFQEQIYAINCKDDGKTGSATSSFMGRATRTGILNSCDRFVDWQKDIRRRCELQEKRVLKKERTVGKETCTVGETVRVQDVQSKKWEVIGVRTADDWTILSYDINIDGTITSRHRKYMCKIRNSDEATVATEEENSTGAQAEPGSSVQ